MRASRNKLNHERITIGPSTLTYVQWFGSGTLTDMVAVNFEEKVFEEMFNSALHNYKDQSMKIAPIGQALEAYLGYDMGISIDRHNPLWRIFGAPALRGFDLKTWASARVSNPGVTTSALNLFFQYKRPERMHGHNATHFNYFRGEYRRFNISRLAGQKSPSQQDTLCQLEAASRGAAYVRYAAPCAISYDDLEADWENNRLLHETVFVTPSSFEPGHLACNYNSPSNVLLNSEPKIYEAGTWGDLSRELSAALDTRRPFKEVLESVSSVVEQLDLGSSLPYRGSNGWDYFEGLFGTSKEIANLLQNTIHSAEALRNVGIDWQVAVREESLE